MSDTGYAAFSTTVAKTNEILGEIEAAFEWPKERRELSYHALRSVLHALRDRLPVKEASDFAAQLPMLVRGLYYENWNPAKVPIKMDREDFLQRVQREFVYEFSGNISEMVGVVLAALMRNITEGEMGDVKSSLPGDIAALLP